MATTLTTSGAVKLLAGAGVNSSITFDNYETLINLAESQISAEINKDVVAGYSGYNSDVKKLLDTAAASLAAVNATAYNTIDYNSLAEAQTVMDKNTFIYSQAISKLKDDKTRTLIGAT